MTFRKVGERVVHAGSLITTAEAEFEAPDGTTFRRDVVHHPGAVVVVPVLAGEKSVLMVRQFRAAVEREMLEVPAGKRDVAGEPVEVTARRELEEEVGMRASRIQKLAEFYNSPGFCDELSHVFMALDMEPATVSAQGVEEQHMTIQEVALDDVPALITSGHLVDAKSIIGLCLTRQALS